MKERERAEQRDDKSRRESEKAEGNKEGNATRM